MQSSETPVAAERRPMNPPTPSKPIGLPWARTLRRGCRMQCPVCGRGKLFTGVFKMIEDCPQCGLHYERLEGHWLGALAVNTMVTFFMLFVALGVTLIVFYPEFPIATMLLILLPIAILAPLVMFRSTRTFWMAMDAILRPPQPGEVHDEYLPENQLAEKSS